MAFLSIAADARKQFERLRPRLGHAAKLGLQAAVLSKKSYAVPRSVRSQRIIRVRGEKAIAVTGCGMPADIDRARAAGFSAHLLKPVDFADLEAAMAASG
jgi:hypothetical protein